MKKTLILMAIVALMFTGCGTITHKDVSTRWQGLGVDLVYQSRVAIPPEMIPEFFDAVSRLEWLLEKMEEQR